jgi:SOS-response transcriptional repressor LexA
LIYSKSFASLQHNNMTKRQKQLLDFIRKYVKKNEITPTYREMAKHLKLISIADIGRMLDRLYEDGKLSKRIPAKPRSTKLL